MQNQCLGSFWNGLPNIENFAAADVSPLSARDAMIFLYCAATSSLVKNAEYLVANPNPVQYDPECVLPKDSFLTEESQRLQGVGVEELIKCGENLMCEQKIPAIAVVANLKRDDQTRLSCLAHPARAKGEYTVACSINGGPRKHSGEELHTIIDKLIDDLESVVYDLWAASEAAKTT